MSDTFSPPLGILLLALAGCGASTGALPPPADAAVDRPAVDTPASAPDTGTRPGCGNVRECAGTPRPTDQRFGRTWSCVVGICTWEPQGGQTCYRDPRGCVRCDTGPSQCPGATACLADLRPETTRVESASCPAGPSLADVVACEGFVVRLRDGTPCLLSDAGTGAIRYVLSCGRCEVVFTPRG